VFILFATCCIAFERVLVDDYDYGGLECGRLFWGVAPPFSWLYGSYELPIQERMRPTYSVTSHGPRRSEMCGDMDIPATNSQEAGEVSKPPILGSYFTQG
jgi:hypothetical protein